MCSLIDKHYDLQGKYTINERIYILTNQSISYICLASISCAVQDYSYAIFKPIFTQMCSALFQ